MTKSDFAFALKQYKKLKDFIKTEFSTEWNKVDHFDIENGKVILYTFNGGGPCVREYSWDELDNKELFSKLDEDIIF